LGLNLDPADLYQRFEVAKGLVREAGQHALSRFRDRSSLSVERKGLQDFVSVADRECEDFIVGALNRFFPDDGFLGEERGKQGLGSAHALWVIDPIDGTANFLRGIPIWCVSLGLVLGRTAVLGIIYNPATDELYAARQGSGAKLNGNSIRTSGVNRLEESRIGLGFSYRRSVDVHSRAVHALLNAHCEYSRLGSGALGLAMTADGRVDGYWEAHINIWDVAAGLCIVREAGGWHNDFIRGDAFENGDFILAATPELAAPLASVLEIQGMGPA